MLWSLVAGFTADKVFGDPSKHHPVAYFGRYAQFLEKHLYRDSKLAGALFTAAAVVPPTLAVAALPAKLRKLVLPVAVWASLGGTTLENVGKHVEADLKAGDVAHARTWVPWLCSRDPHYLDGDGIARAAVESLAENTSDAAVAPLVWARLDDVLGLIPARVTTLIHLGLAPKQREVWRRVARAARTHPSPNAGWVEASAAEALGVTLGGRTVYPHGVENRPELGAGPAPSVETVGRAVHLSRLTQIVALGVGLVLHEFQKRSCRRASNLV